MEYTEFQGREISRVFKGNWQLAGGHGEISRDQAVADLFAYTDAGVNVFDMGDVYTGAEETLGCFLAQYKTQNSPESTEKLRMHTKYIPDMDALEGLSKTDVRKVIERSIGRLGLERLHLVQFHWWDFSKGDFVQTAKYLDELRQEGLIEGVGLTNFDCKHTQEVLDAGVEIVSNQIQFSLIDTRPLNGMMHLAQKNNIAVFCYGSLAGGLLTGSDYDPKNRSHVKYNLMVDEAGRQHFMQIRSELARIALANGVSESTVASQFVLQVPGVTSVILGPRNSNHVGQLSEFNNIHLPNKDFTSLYELAVASSNENQDIYSFERDFTTQHAQIMQYDNGKKQPESS